MTSEQACSSSNPTPATLRRPVDCAVEVTFTAEGFVKTRFGRHIRELVGVARVTVANDAEELRYPCAFTFPARELDRFTPEALVRTAIEGIFQTSDWFAAQLQARRRTVQRLQA